MFNPRPKDKDKPQPENVLSAQEYRTTFLSKAKKKNKFGAKRQTYNGNKYDSTFEAKVAEELDWRLKVGELIEVKRQVKCSLNVHRVFICNYYVDFKTIDKYGQVNYIEAKGFETAEWKLKKRLFMALLPIMDPGATYEVIKA
jgi:hypothetical protein